MTPNAANDFLDAGLGWLLDELEAEVVFARQHQGTNDVCLVAIVRETGLHAKIYGRSRARLLETLQACYPEAEQSIAKLREPAPSPAYCTVMVIYKGLYLFDYKLRGTQGVLN